MGESMQVFTFFSNQVSFRLCAEDTKRFKKPGTGFPPGCRYVWIEDRFGEAVPLSLSSPDYCDRVLNWIESQIANDSIFPENEQDPFPGDFGEISRKILNRLFRLFSIIYHVHFDVVEDKDAALILNTTFKRYLYFMFEFDLLDNKETKSLKDTVDRVRNEYILSPC